MTPRRIYRLSGIVTVFAATLFVGASAMAQMRPGDSGSQTTANPSANPNMNTPDTMQQQASPDSQMQEKAFVREAMEGGMAEVQLGQLAAQKASSDDVKQFGQKMVDDHTRLNEEMQPVAQQLGVTPPTKLSKKDEKTMATLQNLSGAQFDNEYIKCMLKDHKKDAAEFKEEAQQAQNPAVKQAAQQGSQVIDQHLQMIEQIAQSHNVTTGKGKNGSAGQ